MTDSDINEFKSYVLEVLMEKYYLSQDESQQTINNSYLSKVLKNNDDFIFHDSIEECAKCIYEEMRCK